MSSLGIEFLGILRIDKKHKLVRVPVKRKYNILYWVSVHENVLWNLEFILKYLNLLLFIHAKFLRSQLSEYTNESTKSQSVFVYGKKKINKKHVVHTKDTDRVCFRRTMIIVEIYRYAITFRILITKLLGHRLNLLGNNPESFTAF